MKIQCKSNQAGVCIKQIIVDIWFFEHYAEVVKHLNIINYKETLARVCLVWKFDNVFHHLSLLVIQSQTSNLSNYKFLNHTVDYLLLTTIISKLWASFTSHVPTSSSSKLKWLAFVCVIPYAWVHANLNTHLLQTR